MGTEVIIDVHNRAIVGTQDSAHFGRRSLQHGHNDQRICAQTPTTLFLLIHEIPAKEYINRLI